ncbi:DUF6093 family protein [Brevibacterium sanguinis]|uniref:DUF6093 family protein n=1 Tax=Brevibacterium sanguinis TaxID=232444 RepID=UPI0031D25E6D
MSALRAGRALAERMMVDHVIIRRIAGQETDRVTAKVTPVTQVVYDGKAKLQSYEGYEQSRDTAGVQYTVQRLSIQLPVGAYRINVGDVAEIITSTVDPLLVGRQLRLVSEAPFKTFGTAYRVFVDYIAD